MATLQAFSFFLPRTVEIFYRSQVESKPVEFRKSDQLGHRYAHTSYKVFVPWTLYQALMHALPQAAEVFCVHLLHTSYLSLM